MKFFSSKSNRLFQDSYYLAVAMMAMTGVIACSNHLVKIPLNKWVTWGAITYPFSFFITETVNRFYGPKNARRIAYSGFLTAIILGYIFLDARIARASSVAFLASQLLDIAIFNRLRRGAWWLAPLSASILASLVDTLVFFYLAFYGHNTDWLKLGLGDLAIKLIMDVLLLMPFRWFLFSSEN